jgi:hypothetical protein
LEDDDSFPFQNQQIGNITPWGDRPIVVTVRMNRKEYNLLRKLAQPDFSLSQVVRRGIRALEVNSDSRPSAAEAARGLERGVE